MKDWKGVSGRERGSRGKKPTMEESYYGFNEEVQTCS